MLAGDAFHLFSPIGGQGMNTGIQDAINLAWKLAFYLHGVASDRLLASYRTERFAAVSGVLHATDHDTGLIAGLVPKNHIDAVYFPEFCNRHYYRRLCRATERSPERPDGPPCPVVRLYLAAGEVSQQL